MIEAHFKDTYYKFIINPTLSINFLQATNPKLVTLFSLIFGVLTLPLLYLGYPLFALASLLASGFLDTLDGSLARAQKTVSNSGAALDIVSDRIVELSVVLGLYFVDSEARALPTLLILGSIFICVTSFLIVGVFTEKSSQKSFFYSPGIIERAEAFVFFSLMILFPFLFHMLAYTFTSLVFLTAFVRMFQFLMGESLYLTKIVFNREARQSKTVLQSHSRLGKPIFVRHREGESE